MPRVQEELIASKLAGSADIESQNKVYLKIAEENPVLWSLLENVMEDQNRSSDFKEGYYKAAFHFYDLLRTQMEVNHMESDEVEIDDFA